MLSVALTLLLAAGPAPIPWTPWSPDVFQRAKAEHRLVLLDLEAVWCHWCHVMDEKTYADAGVRKLVGAHYLAVRVDQDSSPELSARYEDWGWPATVVFDADGRELAKRQGYLPPGPMAALLQAFVDDPTPGPSVVAEPELGAPVGAALDAGFRKTFDQQTVESYDDAHGGWGQPHRLLDVGIWEYALAAGLRGDAKQLARARQTLQGAIKLIDPVWGGMYQYSQELDWSAPHFEKIISIQADAIRAYALGYETWRDPAFLAAARDVRRYVDQFLASPDGAFFVSQDADLSSKVTGHVYDAWTDAQRRAHGIPRVDRHVYARENGWMITALCALADASGDQTALAEAARAAKWVMGHLRGSDGGYGHGAAADAPALSDTLAMTRAFFALYQSTADRAWLVQARAGLTFIAKRLTDSRGVGYAATTAPAAAQGVFQTAVRHPGDNAELARVANLVFRATGDVTYQDMALRALRYLAALAKADPVVVPPTALLADDEVAREPLHLTLVGTKADAGGQDLYAASREAPSTYRLLEWLDQREGPLPHPVPPFPTLAKPAVYVCKATSCSLPIFTRERLAKVTTPKQ